MQNRSLSLEQDFMYFDVDDLLYGALIHLATYNPEQNKLYLTIQNYEKNRKMLYRLLDCDARNLKDRLKRLMSKGLVKEENVLSNKTTYSAYIFSNEHKGKYQIVDNDMLWYIVSTRNRQAVKIYVQLLNWYLWKQKEGEYFSFTNRDIMDVLGYAYHNSKASSLVSNILKSFKREGVIKYVDYYDTVIDENGKSVPTPKKKLLFVARHESELEKIVDLENL